MKENSYFILAIVFLVPAVVLLALVGFDVVSFPFAGWIPWILGAIGYYFFATANKLEENKTSLFKLLVAVAAIDGDLSEEEGKRIGEYAKQFDIKGDRLKALIESVLEGKATFSVPDDQDEKENNIRALVKIANSDGHIDSKELKLIKDVASKYGLSEGFVDRLL